MTKPRPLAERFWEKVDKSGDCWVWTASLNTRYGQIGITRSRSRMAHRVSWELTHGPIPDGLWVLHRCDNPPCVRPDHLFLGTANDNNKDCAAKGRTRKAKPCRNGCPDIAENWRWVTPSTGKKRRYCIPCHVKYKREWRARKRLPE